MLPYGFMTPKNKPFYTRQSSLCVHFSEHVSYFHAPVNNWLIYTFWEKCIYSSFITFNTKQHFKKRGLKPVLETQKNKKSPLDLDLT